MPGLNALIAPLTREAFFDRHLGREPLISTVAAPLPGWPEFNRALERATIEDRRRFGFSREREVEFDPDDIWLRNGDLALHRVRARIREGHTLIFNNFNFHCDAFGPLKHDIRDVFAESVNVNCYVSVRPQLGFGPHWDDHDVFAIQLEGRKYWALYGFTDSAPLDRDRCAPLPGDARPIWEGVLEKGQCLYIPRGCWHSAVSTGAPSLHAACSLNGLTGVGVLQWLAACARDRPELRAALRPGPAGHPDHAAAARRVCDFLTREATLDLVERFLKDRVTQAEPRQIAGLPEALTGHPAELEGAQVRYFGPNPVETWRTAEGLACVIGGEEIAVPASCAAALQHLTERGEASFSAVQDAAPQASASDLATLVNALEQAGAALIRRRSKAGTEAAQSPAMT